MKVFHHDKFSMGTRFNMVIPNLEAQEGEIHSFKVNQILDDEEVLLSSFIENTELWRVNNEAFERPVEVSDRLAEVIEFCHQVWEKTAKAFDAGLLKYKSTGIFNGSPLRGWEDIKWDCSKRLIRFNSARCGIDLGGLGKGWALEKIKNYLLHEGIQSAFLSFGESSIMAIGAMPNGERWKVKVSHPLTGVSTVIKLKNKSISVSGLKPTIVSGTTLFEPHVINPSASNFITENRLVIAVHESAILAEVLSTAIIAGSPAQVKQVKKTFPEVELRYCNESSKRFTRTKN